MGFFLFFILFILIIGLGLVGGVLNLLGSILRNIFSFGQPPKGTPKNENKQTYNQAAKKQKKIFFNKNEAEDAVFEEI